jgi:hypothetical protein
MPNYRNVLQALDQLRNAVQHARTTLEHNGFHTDPEYIRGVGPDEVVSSSFKAINGALNHMELRVIHGAYLDGHMRVVSEGDPPDR